MTFRSGDLNPRFSVIFQPMIWIFMWSEEPEIKSKQASKIDWTLLFMDKILIPQKVPLNLIVKIDETWTATWLQFFWILVVWESEFDFHDYFLSFFQYFIILEWYNIPFFLWPDVTFDRVSNPYAHSFHLKLFWKINSILHFYWKWGIS